MNFTKELCSWSLKTYKVFESQHKSKTGLAMFNTKKKNQTQDIPRKYSLSIPPSIDSFESLPCALQPDVLRLERTMLSFQPVCAQSFSVNFWVCLHLRLENVVCNRASNGFHCWVFHLIEARKVSHSEGNREGVRTIVWFQFVFSFPSVDC